MLKKKPLKLPGIDALELDLTSIKCGHNPSAADRLIRTFFAEIQQGDLFSQGLGPKEKTFLQYIQHAFGRYVDGQPLETAFGFKLGVGQRTVSDSLR